MMSLNELIKILEDVESIITRHLEGHIIVTCARCDRVLGSSTEIDGDLDVTIKVPPCECQTRKIETLKNAVEYFEVFEEREEGEAQQPIKIDKERIEDAITTISKCYGFSDETSAVGEAWAVITPILDRILTQ